MPHGMKTRSNTSNAKWKRDYPRKMRQRGNKLYSCPYCLLLDEQTNFAALGELVQHVEKSNKGTHHDESKTADGWGIRDWDVLDITFPKSNAEKTEEMDEAKEARETASVDTTDDVHRPALPSIEAIFPSIEPGDTHALTATDPQLQDCRASMLSPIADIQSPFDYRSVFPLYWQGAKLDLPMTPTSEMEFRSAPRTAVIRDKWEDTLAIEEGFAKFIGF